MAGERARTAAKLGLLVVVNVIAFHPVASACNPLLLITVILVARHARVRWGDVVGFMKVLLAAGPGMLVLYLLASNGWIEAVAGAAGFLLACAVLGLASFAFWSATPLRDVVRTLRAARIPASLALALTVGVVFFPVLASGLRRARAHQEARGYRFSLLRPAPLIVPAILHVLDLATNLAISLQSRGYEA